MGIFDQLRERATAPPARAKAADKDPAPAAEGWFGSLSNQVLQRDGLSRTVERLRAEAPPDAVIDWEQQGSLLTLTTTLSREGLHARLVLTCDTAPFRILSRQLFRWDDFLNPDPIEVTDQAARDGGLRVDWRMPDTLTDLERLHRIEAPGLLYGFMPFSTGPYLRDQTLGIKNPQLRMQGQAMQQALRAVSKVNADLVETGVFSAMEGAQAIGQLARPATRLARPLASGASEVAEAGAQPAARRAAGVTGELAEEAEKRLASRVDPETARLVDELFEARGITSGDPIRLVGHATASRARSSQGLLGSLWESAHGIARSIMRHVHGYDPQAALTRLMPRRVHREMDRFWQQQARSLRAQGRTSWTAKEAFDATADSIRRTTGLTELEKWAHIQRLKDEMFVEWGLSETTLVRLPFGP